MGEFQRKVEVFFSELGVSGKKTQSFFESGKKDYRSFLIQKGARKLGYQKDLRNTVRHRGLILPGVKVIIASTTPDGEEVALAQEHDNQVVFPSEEIKEWLYFGKTAIESPTLAAYHKVFEIIGENLDFDLKYIGEKTTTVVQENRDIIYDISMFYKAEAPYEILEKIARNGKWKVLSFAEFELML